jgi:hypothetical protein
MKERSKRGREGFPIKERKAAANSNRSVDRSSASIIAIGERFRMSSLGAARNPRLADKEGRIVGASRLNSSIRVLFDGRKTPISLHRDYIEPSTSESK